MATQAPPRHDAVSGRQAAGEIAPTDGPQTRQPDDAGTGRHTTVEIMLTAKPPARQPNGVDRIGMTPSGRRRRSDALPENTLYRDKGCGGGCDRSLDCPFDRCRLDEPMAARRKERARRDTAIVRARLKEGLAATVLAERFNVSPRTVYRVLQSAQEMRDAPRYRRKAQTA